MKKRNNIIFTGISFMLMMLVSATSFAQLTLENIAAARYTLAGAERHVICNSDPDDVLYESTSATPAGLLAARAARVPGTQIDTYIYCTSIGIPIVVHNSTVGEVYTNTASPFGNNITQDLIDQGTDALKVVTDYMHDNDIEVFWSQRMNDIHDSSAPILLSQFKQNNPQYMVGTQEDHPLYGWWSALDYYYTDVRALVFNLVQEVCYNYDVDGIELDFFRNAIFFKTVADGGTASQAECDLMTDLLENIRAMADIRGVERQWPILIEAHVPDSVEYCKAIGLDIEEWVERGLIDMLVTGGEFQLNPYEYSVGLSTQYNIPVWPCISMPDWMPAGTELEAYHRSSNESWRARAMNAWQAGAPGIYTFNLPTVLAYAPRYNELGSTATLAGLDKFFYCSPLIHYCAGYLLTNGALYQNIANLNPYTASANIAAGASFIEVFPVGDNISSNGGTATGIVHYVATNIAMASRLALQINGEDQGAGTTSVDAGQHQIIKFTIDPDALEQGDNQFEIGLKQWDGSYSAENPWDVSYIAEELPQSPWGSYITSTNTATIGNGALHITDNSSGFAYYYKNWNMSAAYKTVVEARMKLISSANNSVAVCIANGTNAELLVFEPTRIMTYHSQLTYNMDTTNAFHTYKIITKNHDIKVYVDGMLRIDGTGQFTQASTANYIWFGSGGSWTTGESLWEYVKYAKLDLNYAGVLPQSPWSYSVTSTNTMTNDAGALHITDNSSGFAYCYRSWGMSTACEAVVEARMRLVASANSGAAMCVANGTNAELLVFEPTRIKTFYSQLTYNMDTTNAFHTYAITLRDHDIKIYVDGVLRIDGTGRFTQASTANYIWFGSGGSTGTGETWWEYVQYASREKLDVNYLGGALPQSPWVSGLTGTNTATIDNGALHITDNSGGFAYYYRSWNPNPAHDTVVEARMRLVNSSNDNVCVSVKDGSNEELLVFEPARIKTYHSQLTYNMDTTNAFHTYKIATRGNDIKIYVDGVLRIDGAGQFTTTTTAKNIWFGSGGSWTVGESFWEYVKTSTIAPEDVLLKDFIISADY